METEIKFEDLNLENKTWLKSKIEQLLQSGEKLTAANYIKMFGSDGLLNLLRVIRFSGVQCNAAHDVLSFLNQGVKSLLQERKNIEWLANENQERYKIACEFVEYPQKLLDDYAHKKAYIEKVEKLSSRSAAIRTLEAAYYGESSNSWQKLSSVMRGVLEACCISVVWKDGDFPLKDLGSTGYWFSLDRCYQIAIENRNTSCISALEKGYNITPFIAKGNRMYAGREFCAAEPVEVEGKEMKKNIWYKCTGWNEAGELKLMRYKDGRSGSFNSLKFTRKEWLEWIKGKDFQF